ncbi:hypothetical protein QQX98_003287 [Neonectria punicea]|uniref:C3H1-type domain-containing protein n=1 Tax=Neonectria punicea TaxID=979145 RepID=A0ABR1HEA8_9HYPO
MSQYGYGYGPQGYQPANTFAHAPSSVYAAPPYPANETVQPRNPGPESIALESYEFNRQTIPGLGLNFTNNNAGWQHAWANGPAEGPAESQPERSQVGLAEHAPTADTSVRKVPTSQARPSADVVVDDLVEEGELSEGELEDIYEPGQVESAARGKLQPETQELLPLSSSLGQFVGKAVVPARHWDPEQLIRERSGSYSPYLSPREIRSNGQASSASDAVDTPRSQPNEKTVEHSARNGSIDMDTSEEQIPLQEVAQDRLNEAKKRAQDAIVRLWPLNVRYQNYLEEGIDRHLLDGLFTELGLESTVTKPIPEPSATSSPIHPEERPEERHHSISDKKKPDKAHCSTGRTGKPKDKSEERKDRIARLLAAKGSKAPVVAPEPSIGTPAPTAPTAPAPNKTQSEKSKLIQQKMEALRKSREANANKPSQVNGSTTPGIDISHSGPPALPRASVADTAPVFELSDPVLVIDEPPATLIRSDPHGAPPIPGLFLSSTPQPSPAANQRKRPVAADLNEHSTPANFKRPFGQTRESRPFLIDVSDDEDDAEMEIDSPEQRPSSLHRATTPSGRTASFRDHPALSDNIPHRQLSSPKGAATPTSQGGNGNGMYDLESMNKKIEDMKRKIAEAEARKKAKKSSNGTPSLPQSQDQSKEGSADVPSIAKPTTMVVTSLETEAEGGNQSARLPSQPMAQPSLKLAKRRGQKRHTISPIRSRAASARLPVLEAHRSEQTRQLKHLQAEVARIEKAIQDSLQEELRLREEVMVSEPDQGARDGSEPENVSAESDSEPQPADLHPANSIETTKPIGSSGQQQGSLGEGLASVGNGNGLTDAYTLAQAETVHGQEIDEEAGSSPRAGVTGHPVASAHDGLAPADGNSAREEESQLGDDSSSDMDPETDIAMDEAVGSSSEDDEGASGDDYEPTEAGVELTSRQSPAMLARSSTPNDQDAVLETSDTDLQGVSATSPVTRPISAAVRDSASVSGSGREVEQTTALSGPGASKSTFAPYQTPLQYFRAYRFHPQFKDTVAGGLRSLTYSNKIDVKREVCPDQLVGAVCPRGDQCKFQHFENMKAPGTCNLVSQPEERRGIVPGEVNANVPSGETDDQILLQLGAYGNYEGEQKQNYITGLRDLLTGFRNRKIKDFQAISDGIIEYRSQFHGDKTKILPLGSVAI